ncbi:uncharacterized protein LOC141822983 [Curcuma longa]|uniref:uncharacterized protein LOC141822983 n=1 Tax=Curcuma longa TaxID=136217 RepID=UPI003D9E0F8D
MDQLQEAITAAAAAMISSVSTRLDELRVRVLMKLEDPMKLEDKFKQFEEKMTGLQHLQYIGRGKESQVMEQLNLVALYLDEINTDPKSAINSQQMDRLLEAITKAAAADVISRLSTRLDQLKVRVPPNLQDKFKQIEAKMTDLQHIERGRESQVVVQLNLAADCLDKINTDPNSIVNSQHMDRLLELITKSAAAAAGDEDTDKKDTDQSEEPEGVTVVEQKLQKSPAWAHLKLVVDSLDPLLKNCLFTLTVFPPNVNIKKRLLLHWWMGEGFVRCIKDGKGCFDQLVGKGLVVPVGKRHCGKHHYCRVQSWLRPLLVAVSNTNGFLDYDEAGKPTDDCSFSHRLCLLPRPHQELASPKDRMADSRLMTVYNVGNLQPKFPPEWLLNKKQLTTLQLGWWRKDDKKRPPLAFSDNEFLSGLGKCSGLRYLSLRGISRLERLPHHSVEKLRKLVVLDLRACHNLEKLPPNLGDAHRLQFLDVSDCTLLDQMPKTLASLSELEVLKGFVVCDYWNKNCCQIGDLLKLTKLRKLSITTSREFNDREVVKLSELINGLTSLTVTWGVVTKEENTTKRKAEKENAHSGDKNLKFTFPSKLEKLELRCFNEQRLPKWIVPDKLKNLKKLYMTGGLLKSLKDAQGKTWCVKVLRVRFLPNLQDDWESITTWFPDLNCVEKSKCKLLPDWPCDKEGYWQRDVGKSSDDEVEGEVGESSSVNSKNKVKEGSNSEDGGKVGEIRNGSEIEESSNDGVEDEARKSNRSEVEESSNAGVEDEARKSNRSEDEESSNAGVEDEARKSKDEESSNAEDESEVGESSDAEDENEVGENSNAKDESEVAESNRSEDEESSNAEDESEVGESSNNDSNSEAKEGSNTVVGGGRKK